ncbi:MAG: aminotransferase class I/II-fold pyridoxal phosphate-dependent enzyme [Desulfovibrio sp.]|jgi:8-amino-7-oxononanoate synthase|nr:aminotransferase class I/II-fold pyridoxal phosphate-dependent enzyme [Desulfovibrio sp.]
MTNKADSLFGLDEDAQKDMLDRLREHSFALTEPSRTTDQDAPEPHGLGQHTALRRRAVTSVPEYFGSIAALPEYKQMCVQRLIAEKVGIMEPFFICHESIAKGKTRIQGQDFLNFATYDYLGLNGHPEVIAVAEQTMHEFGTSAGASRLVAGERPQHAALEKALAAMYGVADAVVFVSGHATNVSTLSTLLGARDAVYHDALAHNSLILGAVLSGAARYSYPHNDCEALERLLRQTREKHERVIIATEGLFSMDGSIAKLPELIALKQEYTCFLMIDEAHSLGTLGANGYGVSEHFGVDPTDVDIWMGTLSKTLCSCGGFIAGCSELVELLKYRAPGFVYSVGMSPPLAAASTKALEIMLREPERTSRLQALSAFFLHEAKSRGLNTGHAQGYAIIPIIVGSSLVAGYLAAALFQRKINVLPIIYPVVEEGMARLRFFLSSEHTEADILTALDALTEELPRAVEKFQ